MHLIMGGRVERWLSDEELGEKIAELVVLIGMTPVGKLHIERDDDGLSAIQIVTQPLKESHISMHYINDFCCADVFSCKDFDDQKACEFILGAFLYVSLKEKKLLRREFC